MAVLGRDSELALLARLLDGARVGYSSALVLRGEPGIGKSALLESTAEMASGLRLLTAHGVESESELAFSALQELARPVVNLMRRLPERQRAVLEGALAIGPPVPGDPLAVCAATLSLIAAAAEDGPVLLIVDDAHWLDSPSAAALAFAARRLSMESVVALFAMRTAQPSAFDPTGLPELTISALSDQAAADVLADRSAGAISPEVSERLVRLAGGNPLALLEFAASLSPRQLAGVEQLDLPLPVRGGVEREFARRLDQLSRESRDALVVAAAGEQDDSFVVTAALGKLGLSASAFDAPERAGLVTFAEGRAHFRHPLVRSVVYQTAPSERRRAVHAALAAATGDAVDRRSWHLAAAAAGPDEYVAVELESAAERAAARGGLLTAAHALERAAALSPSTDARARRLLAAATLAVLGGNVHWASGLITAGSPIAGSAPVRADFQHLHGVVERLLRSALRSHEILWDGAAAIVGQDAERAVAMMIEAVNTDIMLGDLEAARASGRRALELAASGSGELQRVAACADDVAGAYRGEVSPEDLGAKAAIAAAESLRLSPIAVAAIDQALTRGLATESQAGRVNLLEEAIKNAREAGALGKLPFLLGHGAGADYITGNWTRARARATEALELAGQTAYRAWALVHLARVTAAEGREQECRTCVDEAFSLARALGHRSLEVHLWSIVGLLELGLGHIAAAVDALVRCAREADTEGLGNPQTVPYEPDLIEALHAAGRSAEAKARIDVLQRRAERVRSQWALAAAARCRGLLADDSLFEAEFRSALALHDEVPSAFERARTQLCFGERLRRARRKAEAEVELSAALSTFELFASPHWAERARHELRAAGFMTRAQIGPSSLEKLTPQELRVALIIAEGASIRDAATQLFLSPKTIEAHLGRTYNKLGVRNRAQLAAIFAQRLPDSRVASARSSDD